MNPILQFIADRFNLDEDRAEEAEIIESIKRGSEFRGTNLWTLIFAIFIASIGLNVNSTAVIIGAMLISPLMGPIQAIGMAFSINDFSLLRKGGKNLAVFATSSVLTSTLYFSITPLHDAGSELLARTTPTIWDVFIAFFGGLAGIIAGTRREKGNVFAGVAIATALMPPLCTVGFGLANQQWLFALGAFYLFFINSVFICLGTVLIVSYLRFHKVEYTSPDQRRRNRLYFTLIVLTTLLPSIYLAYRIVQRSVFEGNARKFAERELARYPTTYLLRHKAVLDGADRHLDMVLLGDPLDSARIDSLRLRLVNYNLAGIRLNVRQGLGNADANEMDPSELKATLLQELLHARSQETGRNAPQATDLLKESRTFLPAIQELGLSQMVVARRDTVPDTIMVAMARMPQEPTRLQSLMLWRWLAARTGADSVRVVFQK